MSRRHVVRAALLLVALLVSLQNAAFADAPVCGFRCNDTVTAGDGQYDITQTAEQPGSGTDHGGHGAAHTNSCPGCTYQLILACPNNHPGGQSDTGCPGQSAGCAAGQLRFRRYVTRPDSVGPEPVGDVCRGASSAPVTAADVAPAVQNYLDHLIPPAPGLRVQPTDMALVNYPVLFDARGLAPVTATFAALGVPVTVHATPVRYDWTIDGVASAMHTTSPGRPYDGHGATLSDGYYVSWVFDHHGVHTVAVTVRWSASFDAAGQAGVPVTGGVTRTSAPVSFTVHEAPGQLVAG